MPGLQERNDFRRALQEACQKEGVRYDESVKRRVHDKLHQKRGSYDQRSNNLSYSELVNLLRDLL